LVLVCGEDEFAVKQRARQLYQQWCAEVGGFDHEIIEATVSHSGEALRVLARLREALQTLPFFGSAKVVWLKDCNFLGDERAAAAQAVTESLASLAEELKTFVWDNVRLLLSAAKVDKRRSFYKTLEKLGTVESFAAWSLEDKDWRFQAETLATRQLRERKKQIDAAALAELVESIGPNARQLSSEIEKLTLYVGERPVITPADVAAVVSRQKLARAFALADALGDRDLPRLLRTLDEELWSMRFDTQKSEIGLLYSLIAKVRVMIFLKELLRAGWLKPEANYARFKDQLERVPAEALPEDKRFNPLAMNPYVLFKALPQCRNYSLPELVRAMEVLLECNRQLIFSSLDEALVLQRALIEIVGGPAPRAAAGKA
jgi:DNA polymerase-3 subunit delta